MGNSTQTRKRAYVLAGPKVEELAARTDEHAQFVVEEHGWAVCVHGESANAR
jgi:DNA-binding IclR family transcriptional regulator